MRTAAGNYGEELIRDELRILKEKRVIAGFIRSKNIVFYGKNFQIDFLIFAPGIGLITLEVKNWAGKVKATSSEKWVQENLGNTKEFGNPCLQVSRTCGLLLQILEKGKINKWPIRPLVVFVNKNATILRSKVNEPQTDIILKSMIEPWIENNSTQEIKYNFTQQEFDSVLKTITGYTHQYENKK
ncbi:nuclease-related domain-containing protein [Citrobacter portucalensis]|uniref:nuclease-related domain-containing protein n=1 Tax=Citrobacter portucalensis TaxID=1639133 RepID=UPI002550D41B|nr:nuclease-related domain-containing protein [Citrobacter portucalensis]EIP1106372.1 NERD domain-containing protein [Citrobacter freundii]WOR30131.1 nuclease-related domain-containing protein [Citrobacter portucalensis]